jgi:hypothetical protein
MGWNASGVSTHTYHRRRFFLACFGLLSGLAMIAGAAMGISQGISAKDSLVGLFGLAATLYCGWMTSYEWRQAKIAD